MSLHPVVLFQVCSITTPDLKLLGLHRAPPHDSQAQTIITANLSPDHSCTAGQHSPFSDGRSSKRSTSKLLTAVAGPCWGFIANMPFNTFYIASESQTQLWFPSTCQAVSDVSCNVSPCSHVAPSEHSPVRQSSFPNTPFPPRGDCASQRSGHKRTGSFPAQERSSPACE